MRSALNHLILGEALDYTAVGRRGHSDVLALQRNYRYSLREDIRRGVNQALLRITLAGKGEDRTENIRAPRLSMLDV